MEKEKDSKSEFDSLFASTYQFVLFDLELAQPRCVLLQCAVKPILELVAQSVIFFVFEFVEQVGHADRCDHCQAGHVQSIRPEVGVGLL